MREWDLHGNSRLLSVMEYRSEKEMTTKALEIRDSMTFIAALAVDMNPSNESQRWLLRRCGYACDSRPNIILTRLDGNETHHGDQATNDPYDREGRTWPVAHHWIIEHWDELSDGSVVDVEFILGERTSPKASERVTDRYAERLGVSQDVTEEPK